MHTKIFVFEWVLNSHHITHTHTHTYTQSDRRTQRRRGPQGTVINKPIRSRPLNKQLMVHLGLVWGQAAIESPHRKTRPSSTYVAEHTHTHTHTLTHTHTHTHNVQRKNNRKKDAGISHCVNFV